MAQLPPNPYSYHTEKSPYLMTVKFGYPGSKIREFLNADYNQWNVKNWIEYATREFCNAYIGHAFDFSYTPSNNIGSLKPVIAIFGGINNDNTDQFIIRSKNIDELYARVTLEMPLDNATVYKIFDGEGNSFFFGGDFEAEKVDDSNWYDVKRISITSLNFMDKLGRRQQVLPKA